MLSKPPWLQSGFVTSRVNVRLVLDPEELNAFTLIVKVPAGLALLIVTLPVIEFAVITPRKPGEEVTRTSTVFVGELEGRIFTFFPAVTLDKGYVPRLCPFVMAHINTENNPNSR